MGSSGGDPVDEPLTEDSLDASEITDLSESQSELPRTPAPPETLGLITPPSTTIKGLTLVTPPSSASCLTLSGSVASVSPLRGSPEVSASWLQRKDDDMSLNVEEYVYHPQVDLNLTDDVSQWEDTRGLTSPIGAPHDWDSIPPDARDTSMEYVLDSVEGFHIPGGRIRALVDSSCPAEISKPVSLEPVYQPRKMSLQDLTHQVHALLLLILLCRTCHRL